MQRTHIHLPGPLRDKLKAIATARGVTLAELVRQVLQSFLDRIKA